MRRRRRRGITLLEVLVALVVLATGMTALQRLLGQSLEGLATDAHLTRAMLAARALLAEAELSPPEPGHLEGVLASQPPGSPGLRFTRDVLGTAHPGLREVRVRVDSAGSPGSGCELVELVRVPTS